VRGAQRHSWFVGEEGGRSKAKSSVECLSTLIPETGVVFDVGAHHGYWSKEFASIHAGGCRVFAFEPLSYNHSILDEVVSGYENVTVEHLALSDEIGEREIYVPVKARGNVGVGLAHFGRESGRDCLVERIKTITLDQYVLDHGISRIDFVKCDVEGAELLMLKGAERCIAKFDMKILLEIAESFTRRVGYSPEEIFDFLSGYGFRAHRTDYVGCTFAPVDRYVGDDDYLFVRNASAESHTG
jgi:FkbM family methyltransferase